MKSSDPILVLAATDVELRDFLQEAGAVSLEGEPVPTARGTIACHPVTIGRCGVGKSSAAFAAGAMIARGSWRAIVNIGCAGAYPGSFVSPGDVLIADRECLADEGVETETGFLGLEALGLPVLDSGGAIFNEIPILPACRMSPKDLAKFSAEIGFPVRAGHLCTVSSCSGNPRRASEIAARWRCLAESTEGAAVALAALRSRLPFLEIRGISHWAGTGDRGSRDIPRAASRAALVAARLIERVDRWEPPAGRARP